MQTHETGVGLVGTRPRAHLRSLFKPPGEELLDGKLARLRECPLRCLSPELLEPRDRLLLGLEVGLALLLWTGQTKAERGPPAAVLTLEDAAFAVASLPPE